MRKNFIFFVFTIGLIASLQTFACDSSSTADMQEMIHVAKYTNAFTQICQGVEGELKNNSINTGFMIGADEPSLETVQQKMPSGLDLKTAKGKNLIELTYNYWQFKRLNKSCMHVLDIQNLIMMPTMEDREINKIKVAQGHPGDEQILKGKMLLTKKVFPLMHESIKFVGTLRKENLFVSGFFLIPKEPSSKQIGQIFEIQSVKIRDTAVMSGLFWQKTTLEELGVDKSVTTETFPELSSSSMKHQDSSQTNQNIIQDLINQLSYEPLCALLHDNCGAAKSHRLKGFISGATYTPPQFCPFTHSYVSETQLLKSQYEGEIETLKESVSRIKENELLKTKAEAQLIKAQSKLNGVLSRIAREQEGEKQREETIQSFTENAEQIDQLRKSMTTISSLFAESVKERMNNNMKAFNTAYASFLKKGAR